MINQKKQLEIQRRLEAMECQLHTVQRTQDLHLQSPSQNHTELQSDISALTLQVTLQQDRAIDLFYYDLLSNEAGSKIILEKEKQTRRARQNDNRKRKKVYNKQSITPSKISRHKL